MSDEAVADADTLADGQAHEGAAADGGATPSEEDTVVEPVKLILGKYKTEEEAIKGHKELEQTLHKQAERLKQLEKESKVESILERVANNTAPKKEESVAPDWDKITQEMGEELTADPAKGIRKVLGTANAWITEEARRVREDGKAELEALKSDYHKLMERIEKVDPDYAKNSELIDGLVADGMPLVKAKEWAKKVREMAAPEAVERLTPGSSTSTRVTARPTDKRVYLSKQERSDMKAEGFTDEQMDTMEAEKQREWAIAAKKGGSR